MLKGKELILATKPFAKEDRNKSWIYLISTLCLVLAAITATTYSFNPMIRFGLSILIALLLVRLFTMYHDFLHRAILKNSIPAKVIFSFFGYYTLNPPSIWKRSHDYHHKHNSKLFSSSSGSFPIYTIRQFNKLSKFEQAKYLFIRHPLTILFGYIFTFWFGMCILSLIRNPKKHWDSVIAMVVHPAIGIIFILIGGWPAFWFAFMIPALISSAIGAYLFYAQHNFPGATFKNKENWSYHDAALHSTSFMKMNRVMRWFTGNIGYHHIHHLNALIPFYRLPEVHKTFSEFKIVQTTSLNPWEIYHCFQVKVWDSDLNQMLRLNEIRKMNKGLTDR